MTLSKLRNFGTTMMTCFNRKLMKPLHLFAFFVVVITLHAADPKASYQQALTEKDEAKKIALLTSAAEGGFLPAQLVLSTAYLAGTGVPQDLVKGKKMLDQAVATGAPEAQLAMGYYYRAGWSGTPDFANAIVWYEKAVARNFAPAQNALGSLYFWEWAYDPTHRTSRDSKRALQLFEQAAAQKDALALGNLASIYLYGDGGIAKNPDKALTYALSAAAAGNIASYFDLAVMHYEGLGVKADADKAKRFLKRALNQGFQKNLEAGANGGSPEAQAQLQKLNEMKYKLGL
jgi:TPR repeat protein